MSAYNDDPIAYKYECAKEAEEDKKYLESLENNLTCADCMLDLTDACIRGAGRAVDDEICDYFMEKE